MNKLPVGQTIKFAYAFTFGEIGTVIGLIWIPAVINAVGSFLAFGGYNGGTPQIAGDGAPPMSGPQAALFLVYFFAAFILSAMMAVAVTQQALGLRKGPALAHFSLGSAEWRVCGGVLGLSGLFLLIVFAIAAVVVVAATAGATLIKALPSALPVIGLIVNLFGLACFCALIYFFVRLSFLFVPAAVSEGSYGLMRSWELTKGNFWRILAVGLAVLLPLLLVEGVAEYFILGPRYFSLVLDAARDSANAAHYSAEQAQIVQSHTPMLLGMGLFLAPVFQGLLFAPAAFAYRGLSGKPVFASKE